MQIIDKTSGRVVVSWAPGLNDEQQMVDAIASDTVSRMQAIRPSQAVIDAVCAKVAARPVGVFRTKAAVIAEVGAALRSYWDETGSAPDGDLLHRQLTAAFTAFLMALKQRV
jgi:hypothetical protein